jgi:hypothetical protein
LTRRLSGPPTDLGKAAHEFLFYRDTEAKATPIKNAARDLIKGWLTLKDQLGRFPNGRVDENGHRYLDFDQPLVIGDVTYTGIQAQRKTSASIDLEAAEKLLREKGGEALYDVVFKRQVVREFDEDELFVLHQQGVLTDDELDSLETETESYALVPVKE